MYQKKCIGSTNFISIASLLIFTVIFHSTEQSSFDEQGSPRERLKSNTFYGSEKQVLRDGKSKLIAFFLFISPHSGFFFRSRIKHRTRARVSLYSKGRWMIRPVRSIYFQTFLFTAFFYLIFCYLLKFRLAALMQKKNVWVIGQFRPLANYFLTQAIKLSTMKFYYNF